MMPYSVIKCLISGDRTPWRLCPDCPRGADAVASHVAQEAVWNCCGDVSRGCHQGADIVGSPARRNQA